MDHNYYIKLAIEEANNSNEEIPVGAVIVRNGEVIAKACNKKESYNDVTAHAEILAIKDAAKKIGNWRLTDCLLYVTLEPCPMCAAAILYSRIPLVCFGSYDSLYGALGSTINMTKYIKHNPKIIGGIEEQECKKLLQDFFKSVRK